jgi:hypothetical protein
VAQVIAIAARNNLVLETGHSSGAEDLVIIQEAKRQGVQNVMVTHALTNPGGPSRWPRFNKPRGWARISNWSMAGLRRTCCARTWK